MVGEWLAHGEWCDVRLLCRGGMFSAHRAVLASASPYLRSILVSHIEQETPLYIALPDVDWEPMSSVLYYIYNGEINIPIEKLSAFIEVINTLNIFVEKGALEDVKNFLNNDNKDYDDLQQDTMIDKEMNKTVEDSSEKYIKLEYEFSNCGDDLSNNQNSKGSFINDGENISRQRNIPYLNLMQHKDGHQNSPLRDLVTETHTWNGIANKLSPNVPTITNERNLQLLSGGVMNGNKNIMDKTEPESVTTATTIINELLNKYYQRYNMNKSDMQNTISFTAEDIKLLKNMLSLRRLATDKCKSDTKSHKSRSIPSLLPIKKQNPVDLSRVLIDDHVESNLSNVEQSRNEYQDKEQVHTKKSHRVRSSPLNQVLGSPWNPRQPRSYRPFKIKQRQSLEDRNKRDIMTSADAWSNNDKNNNLADPIIENDEPEDSSDKIVLTNRDSTESVECNNFDDEISSTEETSGDSKKVTSRARHTCGECGKSFSQLRNYKYHLSVHRGTKEFAATCTVCGKYFNDRGYLSSHMKIHRNQKEYQCPHCPKSFNQRVAYNMHIRIHTGVKPHVCEECGKAFSRKMLLKQHQRTHSGERPYACSFCDKRFADRSNMTLHMRLHSGVKPFTCTMCPKSFTKKHHLKTHLNFHTGAKPYSCPQCQMTFSQSSNMRTHLKKCTAETTAT